jgi:hypothetical protein
MMTRVTMLGVTRDVAAFSAATALGGLHKTSVSVLCANDEFGDSHIELWSGKEVPGNAGVVVGAAVTVLVGVAMGGRE